MILWGRLVSCQSLKKITTTIKQLLLLFIILLLIIIVSRDFPLGNNITIIRMLDGYNTFVMALRTYEMPP